jgi:ankyrin repeat protein
MLSLKRWRKSRRPPTDPQPSSSKTSTEITPAEAVSQELSEDVASGAGPETELGQLTLQARLDVTQEQIAVTDLRPHGHNFNGNVVTENARAHFGNVYNFNQPPFSVLDDTARPDLMKALSFSGMSHRLMSITPAYAETCKWILDQPEYLRWRDPGQRLSHHGVFWIKGKAGTGKSTLMSCMHEHQQDRDGITVSFFFNARSPDKLVKSTEGMYRCLLHQILTQSPRLKASLSHIEVPKEGAPWPIEWLESAFRITILGISTDEEITCFVDALDECKIEDVRRAIERFEDLSESVTRSKIQFRICFSSRYYPQITMRRHEELKLDEQLEHMNDISRYIDAKLTVREGVKLELSLKIFARCSGIFLWVVLVVRRLREASDTGSTRSQLLAVLDATPEELEELFADVVAGSDKSLTAVVQWSLFSMRELTTKELYFAVQASVSETGAGCWDVDGIDDDGMVRYLIHASRGLMEASESTVGKCRLDGVRMYSSEQVLTFIHESVREYFLCGGPASKIKSSLHEKNAVGHAKLAEACLSYLESAVSQPSFSALCRLGHRTERHEERLPFIWYASDSFFGHADIAYASDVFDLANIERLPLQYTETPFNDSVPDGRRLQHGTSPSLLYILLHRRCFELARAFLTQSSRPSRCPKAQHDITSTPSTPTRLVAPDLKVAYDELSLAILLGRTDLVQLFFDNGFDVNMAAGPWGRPICFAVSQNQYQVVQILSDHGARVDIVETGNILHIAAKHAWGEEMVQLLLWKGVDVNGKDERSQTALHATARRLYFNYGKHDVTIARILLKAGADIEAADEHGETALIKAAAGRRTHLVKALLRNGANVYARDHCQSTALHAAADDDKGRRRSDAEMYSTLQVLLDAGADIDAEDGLQNTVLSNACFGRHRGLTSFLVERGAMFTPRGVPGEDFFTSLFLEETNRHGCDDQPGSPIAETWSIDGQDSFDEE